jgi:hypothetical protein
MLPAGSRWERAGALDAIVKRTGRMGAAGPRRELTEAERLVFDAWLIALEHRIGMPGRRVLFNLL